MKKPICLALTAMLTFSGSAINTTNTFADDFSKHWADDAIRVLSMNHFILGDGEGNFRPDTPITRAEFVTTVNKVFSFTRAMENESGTKAAKFSDIKGSEWFADAVDIAVAKGYVSGYQDGTFKPNAPITRAEMAVMIAKVLKLEQSEQSSTFTDDKEIPVWAKGYVEALKNIGYVTGFADGSFKANQKVTRGESFVVFAKAVEKNPELLENSKKMMDDEQKKSEEKSEPKTSEQKKAEPKKQDEEETGSHSRSYTAAEKAAAAKKAEEAFKKIHEAKDGKKIELEELKKLIKDIDSQRKVLAGQSWTELEKKLEQEMNGKITDILASAKKEAKMVEEIQKLNKAFTENGMFKASSDAGLTLEANLMKETDSPDAPEKITTVNINDEREIEKSFLPLMRNKGVGKYYVNIKATPTFLTPIDFKTDTIEIKVLDNTEWLLKFEGKDGNFKNTEDNQHIRVNWENKTISWDAVENATSYDIKAEFTYNSQETVMGNKFLLDEPKEMQNQFDSETLEKESDINLINPKGKRKERIFVATGLKGTEISFDQFILVQSGGVAAETFDNVRDDEQKQEKSIVVKISIIPRNEGLYITEDYKSNQPEKVNQNSKKRIFIESDISTWFKYFPKIKPSN